MVKLLVAGCSSGIGEYLYQFYRECNFHVTAGCSRSSGDYRLDCTNESMVEIMMRDFKPDILINCVGAARMNHTLLSSESMYNDIVDANLKSTFLLCREAARIMTMKGFGRIVNFGSCTTAMEIPGESIYTAAKCGVVGFSRVLAKELPSSITVNVVSPGPVDTPLLHGVKKEKIEEIVNRQIIKKQATFKDILHVVDWLIDEKTSMVTGQNIFINGAG